MNNKKNNNSFLKNIIVLNKRDIMWISIIFSLNYYFVLDNRKTKTRNKQILIIKYNYWISIKRNNKIQEELGLGDQQNDKGAIQRHPPPWDASVSSNLIMTMVKFEKFYCFCDHTKYFVVTQYI